MSSREEFEKWAQSQRLHTDRWIDSDHNTEYLDVRTLRAWHAWKAATERAAKVCEREATYHRAYGRIEERTIANRADQAIREGNE